MKLNEIYTPVFEAEEGEGKVRRLRSDFGSKKTELECPHCGHTFNKRTGPNSAAIKCPECGNDRVKLALSEVCKQKVHAMKESMEEGNYADVADKSLDVLGSLVGDTKPSSLTQIQEALAGLATVEPALGNTVRELSKKVKTGEGRDELADIAEKMGFGKYFKEEK